MNDPMLILPLVLLVAMLFFMWRSNRKQQSKQQEMRAQLAPGVEVMTQTGIYGTLIELDTDANTALLESTPGTLLKVHSATIATVVTPDVVVPDDASALEDDSLANGDSTAVDPVDNDATDDGLTAEPRTDSDDDQPKA